MPKNEFEILEDEPENTESKSKKVAASNNIDKNRGHHIPTYPKF